MNEITLENDEFVSVTVLIPKHRVGTFYRLVADIFEGICPPSLPSPPDERFQWWHTDEIRQLKQEVSNPTVLALLELTAQRAGQWVTFDEIFQHAGRSARQAQGDLAGFTQLIKRHFKKNIKGYWPVEIESSGKPIKYRMPLEVAQYWKEA